MPNLPYIVFTNETLDTLPYAKKGQLITCPTCGGQHRLEPSTNQETGEESDFLLFYTCGASTYLAGVRGRLIVDQEADESGDMEGS